MTINRRTFAIRSILGSAALVAVDLSQAQAAMLVETSPQASALGYKADASKIDSAQQPKYATGQKCATCQMFNAKQPSPAPGACAIFPGKLVSGEGWCSAFVPKA
ncbi:MAG: high-potential iron-sulfur protein [Burkholderiaceae bacterium]